MARGVCYGRPSFTYHSQIAGRKVISGHGVPSELLSERGAAFLSRLMLDVYWLMGITKTNTAAYHSQTDGLVERFHI